MLLELKAASNPQIYEENNNSRDTDTVTIVTIDKNSNNNNNNNNDNCYKNGARKRSSKIT
ncbi:putative uncharacterized protein DDB_G0284297 [Drosophila sulfurigaster albostrigata]|uniref:putative uncharacterized protein DDB_G0284297 n=1 Tax=Drosophila sulfurigaster albostrigata TaxID=89887 RepID=UPI002D21C7C7|nr:putative uncharacterized protein DDB_G0284297 [Drosophila sulfurigaster albostrigata]